MLRSTAAAVLVLAAGAVHAPALLWGGGLPGSDSGVVTADGFSRGALLARVRAWGAANAGDSASLAPRAISLFLVDELHADELAALSSSNEPTATAALGALRDVLAAGGGLVIPRAFLHDAAQSARGPLRDELAAALPSVCAVTEVGDGATELSRDAYEAALTDPGAAGCRAFVVPLRRAALVSELSAVARFAAAAGPAHAFLLTAEAAPTPAYADFDGAVDKADSGSFGGARVLQTAGTYIAVGNIRMNPDILAGLVISLLLGAIVLIGVQCTLSVKTPDVMHSFTLPAGREY